MGVCTSGRYRSSSSRPIMAVSPFHGQRDEHILAGFVLEAWRPREMECHRSLRHGLTSCERRVVRRHSERPDTREAVRHLVALAGIVIPIELAELLALRELVRRV